MAKILIVEDDKVLNDAYRMILTKEGHDVETAFDGQEALEKTETFAPSIILLDLLMPRKSGLDFLQEFDLLNKHPDTTVVILSNIGDEKEVDRAIKLGAYKYIVKAHASPAELSQLVNHLINKNIEKKPEAEEE
jgi:two-component system response regulator VicR